jgi:hypothetical protein
LKIPPPVLTREPFGTGAKWCSAAPWREKARKLSLLHLWLFVRYDGLGGAIYDGYYFPKSAIFHNQNIFFLASALQITF